MDFGSTKGEKRKRNLSLLLDSRICTNIYLHWFKKGNFQLWKGDNGALFRVLTGLIKTDHSGKN